MVLGELDVAQNNQDLSAEHGRSLFDSRQRFAGSVTYAIPFARGLTSLSRTVLDGWQFNALLAVIPALPSQSTTPRMSRCRRRTPESLACSEIAQCCRQSE